MKFTCWFWLHAFLYYHFPNFFSLPAVIIISVLHVLLYNSSVKLIAQFSCGLQHLYSCFQQVAAKLAGMRQHLTSSSSPDGGKASGTIPVPVPSACTEGWKQRDTLLMYTSKGVRASAKVHSSLIIGMIECLPIWWRNVKPRIHVQSVGQPVCQRVGSMYIRHIRFANRLANRFANRLYRVYKHLSVGPTVGWRVGWIKRVWFIQPFAGQQLHRVYVLTTRCPTGWMIDANELSSADQSRGDPADVRLAPSQALMNERIGKHCVQCGLLHNEKGCQNVYRIAMRWSHKICVPWNTLELNLLHNSKSQLTRMPIRFPLNVQLSN
jgi:hypothetical protein